MSDVRCYYESINWRCGLDRHHGGAHSDGAMNRSIVRGSLADDPAALLRQLNEARKALPYRNPSSWTTGFDAGWAKAVEALTTVLRAAERGDE